MDPAEVGCLTESTTDYFNLLELMSASYPLPGSLGEAVYQATEDELDDRFDRAPEKEPTRLVLAEGVDLTSLRFERLIGNIVWMAQDDGLVLVIEAQFPPGSKRPHAVSFTFALETTDKLFVTIEELGFPLPDQDPAYLAGDRTSPQGKTTTYLPGPPGLSQLSYRVQDDGGHHLMVSIDSERPPEPKFSERVKELKALVDWQGTLRFNDLESVQQRTVDEHIRPGKVRARTLI